MEQTPPQAHEVSPTDVFVFLHVSGLSLGAFAARCKVDVRTLVLHAAGLTDNARELTRDRVVRALRRKTGEEPVMTYIATRAPNGLRWHQWVVPRPAVEEIVRSRGKPYISFTTTDNLTVLVNTKHVIAMVCGDDVESVIDTRAIVCWQTVAGSYIQHRISHDVLKGEFSRFRAMAKEISENPRGDDIERIFELPYQYDRRRPRAFLVDFHQTFMDYAVDDLETAESYRLWDVLMIPDGFEGDCMVAFDDADGATSEIWLRDDQVTVLECPTHLIDRASYRDEIDGGGEQMTPESLRRELDEEGLFSEDEKTDFVARLQTARRHKVTPAMPKKRGPQRPVVRKSAAVDPLFAQLVAELDVADAPVLVEQAEQDTKPVPPSNSEGLSPDGFRLLRESGLSDRIAWVMGSSEMTIEEIEAALMQAGLRRTSETRHFIYGVLQSARTRIFAADGNETGSTKAFVKMSGGKKYRSYTSNDPASEPERQDTQAQMPFALD